jgi:site-specific DNA-methyltransferase (adenine-specific)/site-specific DNA-methyltransferase (cytosine-N4-specific)
MILEGDCFELIKTLKDNSVDLVITSPPYADIVNYGKNISIKKPNEYCDWLLPIFNEIYRVLKPSGSFILNINDNCSGGYRNPFIYELIYRSQKETKLKFYDTYIWHKMNGIPNGSPKRFRNMTEFIFHFVKNQKELKFQFDTNIEVRPDNVFRFPTAGQARDNHIKHPAPYHRQLPEYFIKLLTDEGDTVVDIFAGIGTTGLPCKDLNRYFIGFELNPKYVEFGNKRIQGEELDEYVINQYDLEDNFIRSWKTITEIENTLGFDSHNHIEDCIRKGNKTSYGFQWKLENKI